MSDGPPTLTADEWEAFRVVVAQGWADTTGKTHHGMIEHRVALRLQAKGLVELDAGARATLTELGKRESMRDGG